MLADYLNTDQLARHKKRAYLRHVASKRMARGHKAEAVGYVRLARRRRPMRRRRPWPELLLRTRPDLYQARAKRRNRARFLNRKEKSPLP